MKTVAGKVVVITGASSGAGWAMAMSLAKAGAKLILAARRKEALDEAAQECIALGAEVWTVTTDTKNAASVQALATAAIEYAGGIDVWINNAGVLAIGATDEIPLEVNESVIATNLIGYVHGAQVAVSLFKAQGFGILINNISIGAWLPTGYMTAYSASKFGIEGFSQALRGELAPYKNIHICNLYPGFLDTPGMQHAANFSNKELTPAPPLTDPREVADAVVQLIRKPKETTTVGPFPHLMRLAYRTSPKLTRNITASFIRKFLEKAPPSASGPGNVLEPVPYGIGADGGWRRTLTHSVVKPAVLASVAAGLLFALVASRMK